MNTKIQILILSFLLLPCIAFSQSGKSKVLAKGATLHLLAEDYKFTEGPAADSEGNVYFTDQPNNRIMKWSTEGTISVFMKPAGRANGLYVDQQGRLLACADEENELWRIGPDKEVTVLVDEYKGRKLNGPNDLWIDPQGGIYFTDPFYKREYWTRTEKEIESENVYYLSPDGETLAPVATDLVRPNGIVGTPDGKQLYVADINGKKTYIYRINKDGSLTDKKLFAPMGSDGMTLDRKGNLYLTGKGVTVFNKQGEKIEHIPVDEGWTANVCFGGKNHKTLFITAMDSIYSIEMKVKGAR